MKKKFNDADHDHNNGKNDQHDDDPLLDVPFQYHYHTNQRFFAYYDLSSENTEDDSVDDSFYSVLSGLEKDKKKNEEYKRKQMNPLFVHIESNKNEFSFSLNGHDHYIKVKKDQNSDTNNNK